MAAAKQYTVAKGKSVSFRAGIKVHGDVVEQEWPEFKANQNLLADMLKNKTLVPLSAESAPVKTDE